MRNFFPAAILALTLSTFALGQGAIVQTFAGGALPQGVAGPTVNLGQLANLAVDSTGNVYIPVMDYHVVLKLDKSNLNLTVVAGTGTSGYSGDGGLATAAQLSGPLGIAVDGAGNLYIADTGNHAIRLVSKASGNITTIAGNGTPGYSGDGGPANAAQLNTPSGVAVDSNGILYIADTQNQRIRKVVVNGNITTIAGSGVQGFGGDNQNAIGPNTKLNNPFSVVVDPAGNVYIADWFNHRIRRVSSGLISTVIGNGTAGIAGDNGPASLAQLNFPNSIALDTFGNLYISDQGNFRIRKVASNVITTIAGTGVPGSSGDGSQATTAQLGSPWGVTVDGSGNVYIADRGQFGNSSRVRKVSGGIITTVAGTGGTGAAGDGSQAVNAQLNAPKGVALDAVGNVYIADTNDNRVRVVTRSGITTIAGRGVPGNTGDGGPAINATLGLPAAVAVDANGIVYIADTANSVVRKISSGTVTTIAGTGVAGNNGDPGPATSTQLNQPAGIAVDSAGVVYVADTGNGLIRRISGGTLATIAGGASIPGFGGTFLSSPIGIAVDRLGNIYVADAGSQNRIWKITGTSISPFAGTGIGGFSGDNGPALSALLNRPSGVAVDAAGIVYIADTGNQRIRQVGLNGLITTIAGNGITGFAGDGGPPTGAEFNGPTGIAVDAAGRTIYVADTLNQRIRAIGPPASTCSFSLDTTALQPSSAGGTFPVGIQTSSFCNWTIAGLPTWITVASGNLFGTGPSTVTLVVAANTGASRTATITVNDAALTVIQQASNGCTYTLSPGGQAIPAAGGSGFITIAAGAACAWSVTGAPSWINIIGSTTGFGNGTLTFVVLPNLGTARAANLSFPGVSFLVDQAANSILGFTNTGSIAQVATGGGWDTTLWLVNPSQTVPVQMRLSLFDDNGIPLTSLLNFPQNPSAAGPELASTIDRTLAPGTLLIVDVTPLNPQITVQGWAQVLSDVGVGGSGTFRFTAGSLDHQALIPIETRNAAAYLIPFDNTGGFVAGIALANTALQAGNIGMTIRDDTGAVLLTTTRRLNGDGHTAFVLPTDFSVTAGKRGTVEFDIPFGGQISVLGIQYNNNSGGFSTILPVVKQ